MSIDEFTGAWLTRSMQLYTSRNLSDSRAGKRFCSI
jgi:hypothetical protein